LSDRLIVIKGTKGVFQKFLEAYILQLSVKEDWKTFMDVLARTLYGVMLFPNVGNYVKYAIVNIFVVVKTRFENLVTTILDDTYLALDLSYERKIKKLSCCLPILYIWLMARIGDNVIGIRCQIELVTRRRLEMRGAKEWAQCFTGLNQKKILWHPSWQQRKSIIYSC